MPRVSHFIRRKTAANIHHAIRIADALGSPLNTFVTVNFSMTACEVEKVSEAFARLRNSRFSHWARRPSRRSGAAPFKPAFIWVIEAGGGVTAAHWLVSIPPERRADFEKKLAKWIDAVAGGSFRSTINIKDAPNPRGVGRYILKGMDPAWAAMFGIRFKDQGKVYGRRCGYSLNLGPTVKRKLREDGQYRQASRWKRLPPLPASVKVPARTPRTTPSPIEVRPD